MDLLVTEKLIKLTKRRQRGTLILIIHLTPNSTKFIELLSQCYEIKLIVGIPYSSSSELAASLSANFEVVIPSDLAQIDKVVLDKLQSSDQKVLILEIGGYC